MPMIDPHVHRSDRGDSLARYAGPVELGQTTQRAGIGPAGLAMIAAAAPGS